MQRRALAAVMLLVVLACSDGSGDSGGDALIVPESVSVRAVGGGSGELELFALTLQAGPSGPELYVAVRNAGDAPACSAAVSVELYDHGEQSIGAGVGGLLSQRFYQLTDGTGAIASCLDPGDTSMAAVMDLPGELAVEEVAHVVYRCPHFALEVEPVAGLSVSDVQRVTSSAGARYTGTLENDFERAVHNPSVTVFPTSASGRPLGMAQAEGSVEIAPGGRWSFETSVVQTAGAGFVAFPAGAIAQ